MSALKINIFPNQKKEDLKSMEQKFKEIDENEESQLNPNLILKFGCNDYTKNIVTKMFDKNNLSTYFYKYNNKKLSMVDVSSDHIDADYIHIYKTLFFIMTGVISLTEKEYPGDII